MENPKNLEVLPEEQMAIPTCIFCILISIVFSYCVYKFLKVLIQEILQEENNFNHFPNFNEERRLLAEKERDRLSVRLDEAKFELQLFRGCIEEKYKDISRLERENVTEKQKQEEQLINIRDEIQSLITQVNIQDFSLNLSADHTEDLK